MHESLLAEAALPAPTTILGLAVRPYSIGHELWLLRQGNPLVCGGEVKRSQVFEAVLLCTCGWDDAPALNRDLLMPLKLKIWRWRTRKEMTALAQEQFRYYRERGSLCFKVNPQHGGQVIEHRPGAPFLLRLQMFLMEQMHLTESAAWDYPLGLAQMKWCAHWESKGGLEVQNDLDVETQGFADDNDARLKVMIDGGMTPEAAWEKLLEEGLSRQN